MLVGEDKPLMGENQGLLHPDDRRQLKAWLSQGLPPRLQRRAQILLLYDQGRTTREISAIAGLSPGRTRYWRRRYRIKGMAVFPPGSMPDFQPAGDLLPTPQVETPGDRRSPQVGDEAGQERIKMQASDQGQAAGEILGANPQHIQTLAGALFDRLQPLHGLNEDQRALLVAAAWLVKQSPFLRGRKTISTMRQWVSGRLSGNTVGEFSQAEQVVLAAILAYPPGKKKWRELDSAELPLVGKRAVQLLAAILRIAEALDGSGSQATQIVRVEPAPDGTWIVVDGPYAEQDAAAAQKAARLWNQAGISWLRVLTDGQAQTLWAQQPALPLPQERIGLRPEDSMAEAGRKAMYFHFAEMLRHEEGTRLGEDIEALHDMRVATRRMRAAFEIFGDAFEPKALKPHLKGLRATGRALGRVRDLDVFMEKARHYLDGLPEDQRTGLDPLLSAWQAQREEAREVMLAHLDSQAYRLFKYSFNQFLNSPGEGVRPAPNEGLVPFRVRDVAPVLVYTRLAAVRAFQEVIENASLPQLHALRIEFKKLRYAVEFFREVLGGEARAVIGDLKKLQDHLGDLNDANVATQILRSFLDEWEIRQLELPIQERSSPVGVVTYLAARHAERHQLLLTFHEAWAYFLRPEFHRNLALAISVL